MSDAEDDDTVREFSIGLVAGLAAWIVGYVIVYLWRAGSIDDDLRDAVLAFPDEDVTVDGVGWLFYNAHYVFTEHSRQMAAGTFSVNVITENGGSLYALYVLPPALLILAGATVVVLVDATDTPLDSVRAGGMVVAGYLPLSAIGTTVFTVRLGPELIRPDPVFSILLAGLVYPIAFGILGGLLARAVLTR